MCRPWSRVQQFLICRRLVVYEDVGPGTVWSGGWGTGRKTSLLGKRCQEVLRETHWYNGSYSQVSLHACKLVD